MELNLDAKFNWHEIILIIGAYGIVQVLAQDLGIKTGKKQRMSMSILGKSYSKVMRTPLLTCSGGGAEAVITSACGGGE